MTTSTRTYSLGSALRPSTSRTLYTSSPGGVYATRSSMRLRRRRARRAAAAGLGGLLVGRRHQHKVQNTRTNEKVELQE